MISFFFYMVCNNITCYGAVASLINLIYYIMLMFLIASIILFIIAIINEAKRKY